MSFITNMIVIDYAHRGRIIASVLKVQWKRGLHGLDAPKTTIKYVMRLYCRDYLFSNEPLLII